MKARQQLIIASVFALVLASCARTCSRHEQKTSDQPVANVPAAPASGVPSGETSGHPVTPVGQLAPDARASGVPVGGVQKGSPTEATVAPAAPGVTTATGVSGDGVSPVGAGPSGVPQGAPVAVQSPKASPIPEKKPVCFTLSFKDTKRKAAADDDEAWLRQKAELALDHDFKQVVSKSVCVKVNNVPVKFQPQTPAKKKQPSGTVKLLIDPVKPGAEVMVRYCIAKNFCAEECKIPKDEFMDAFSSAAGGIGEGGALAWDDSNKGPSKEENDLRDEDKGLEKDLLGGKAKDEVYKGWVKKDVTPSCEK